MHRPKHFTITAGSNHLTTHLNAISYLLGVCAGQGYCKGDPCTYRDVTVTVTWGHGSGIASDLRKHAGYLIFTLEFSDDQAREGPAAKPCPTEHRTVFQSRQPRCKAEPS